MPNPRLASRYAKSLIDLATEKGQLEEVYSDMQYLQAICKSNRDFVNFLRSPVIKADKKDAILTAITGGKISAITAAFNKLLVKKGREDNVPEIVFEFINQYNQIKGINKVKLTTATDVSDDLKNSIVAKVKAAGNFNSVELESKVDPSIVGGFVLEYNNNLVDASISRDLRDIKKQFQQNVYVHNIR